MKYLIDAQLPRQLVLLFSDCGYDALHTRDLPEGNRSPDITIPTYPDQDGRVVITKDADFVRSHLLVQCPKRLLIIATGNIVNQELFTLLLPQLPHIDDLFETHTYLELTKLALIIHE